MRNWGNLEGLIPLLGGIYGLLMARGVLPLRPRNPEKQEQWRQKFGKLMTVLCPIVILLGVVQLLGFMS